MQKNRRWVEKSDGAKRDLHPRITPSLSMEGGGKRTARATRYECIIREREQTHRGRVRLAVLTMADDVKPGGAFGR